MNTTYANSIEAAVNLAEKWKKRGEYNWFRGQSKDWPADSALSRLDQEGVSFAEERLKQFAIWVNNTPGLESLRNDEDSLIAVAQHYGIPTTFLDFTTEPSIAGFFATQGLNDKSGNGYIYCLNTEDLRKTWTVLSKGSNKYPPIDFITIDVPNLWRMEAQHGVFLFCPKNWDTLWNMRRITFPHRQQQPSYPSTEQVFPSKKSQLELLLDHFFKVEKHRNLDVEALTKKYFPEAMICHLKAPSKGIEHQYFRNRRLPILPEWEVTRLQNWLQVPNEPFYETVLGEIALRVNLRSTPESIRNSVIYGIMEALKLDPSIRKKSLRWINLPHGRIQKDLSNVLDWVWNGLRLLPYGDEELAEAIGTCFALYRVGYQNMDNQQEQIKLSTEVLGTIIPVQFDSWDGSYLTAFVNEKALRESVRSDICEHLRPKYQSYSRHVKPLMMMCSNHKHLFDFQKFTRVFATQIVPTQVMQRGVQACHFSPLRLRGFGIP